MKTLKHLFLTLLFIASIFYARLDSGQAQSAQQAQQLPLTQYVPSHDYDTRNILLKLRFDWEREQTIGTATITFTPLVSNLKQVEFDAANMTFNSVKLANGTSLQYEVNAPKEKLLVKLDRPYQPTDVLTLTIDYHTNGYVKGAGLQGYGKGLTYIKPTADNPNRPRQIWSQGETEYNHYWFPCYDHPNDFTTTEILATVEKPLIVISNGKLISTKENGDNTRTFDWKMDEPHATYLTSIVVGEYAPIEQSYASIPVISYVYPNELAEGKVTVARMADMVKFFSEKTGVKYPYVKYAQTMAEDFPGGMENISATTQTNNMIHDARVELDQTSDSLESHELAHQWFGDYVTCRSWSDIWLNESFATYFQAMWDEHHLGHDDFLYLDVRGNQNQYYNAWRQGNRRPIVTRNYADPNDLFDVYAYPRGAAVLHMLRTFLGEDNWWRAINHYLTKYAHQSVNTEQFRIAIEEATGQSMDWFFDEWLYRMGHPVFEISKSYDAASKKLTLTVKQSQKPVADSQYPQVKLFQTPVDVEIVTANDARVDRVLIEPKEEQTLTFDVASEPQLVNFDYGDTLIKEMEFKKPTEELIYQLSHDQDVMGRLWALGQLAGRLNDKASTDQVQGKVRVAIEDALKQDKFWGIRLEAANALAKTAQPSRTSLIAATKDQDVHVRAAAITALATLKDSSMASTYQQFLNDRSYGVIRAAAVALGGAKSADAYEALVKLLDTPSWQETIRTSGLRGLIALEDKRALDLALKFSAKGNPAQVRGQAFRLLGITGQRDTRAFPALSDALIKAVSEQDFALANSCAEGLVALGDPRGLQLFEDLKAKVDTQGLRDALARFQERLRKTMDEQSKNSEQTK